MNCKKGNRSVEDYIAELTRLAEEVRQVGVALDDRKLTLIALNGLDTSYDAFVTAQSARTDNIPFAAFQGLLQAHDEWFKVSSNSVILMANAVVNDTVITCQMCLKRGHSMISCFNRHNEGRYPMLVDKKSHFYPRFNQKVNGFVNTVWYPNSGATDHVVFDSAKIQQKDSSPLHQLCWLQMANLPLFITLVILKYRLEILNYI